MDRYRFRTHTNFTMATMLFGSLCAVLALMVCFTARTCPAQMAYGGDYNYTQRDAEFALESIVRAQEMYKMKYDCFAPDTATLVKVGDMYDKTFLGITKNGDSVIRNGYFFTQVECKKNSFSYKAVPVNGGTALVANHKRELEEIPDQPPPDPELVKALTERVPSKILRTIAEAQKQYKEKYKAFAPALAVLVKENLLAYKEFADVQKDGEITQAGDYLFIQEKCAGDAYSILAEPVENGLYYSVDQTEKVDSDVRPEDGFSGIERMQNRWRLDRFLSSIVTAQFNYRSNYNTYAPSLSVLSSNDLRSREFFVGDKDQTKAFKHMSIKRNGDGMQYGEHLIVQKECTDQNFKFLAIPIGKNQAFRVDKTGKSSIVQTTSDLRFSQALHSLRKIAFAQETYKASYEKYAPSLAALVNADLLLITELKTVAKNGDSVQIGNFLFTQEFCTDKNFQVSLKFASGKDRAYLVDEHLLVHTNPSGAVSAAEKAPVKQQAPAPPKAKPAPPKKKNPFTKNK